MNTQGFYYIEVNLIIMKLNRINTLRLSIAMLLSFIFYGCSNSIPFESSRIVPAADAEVSVKQEDNNNYAVDIEIENLAKPGRLHPPRNTYVAWYQTDSGPQKIGQIIVNNNLKGSLETVLPNRPNRIFITAEQDPSVEYPNTPIILETGNI